MSTVSPAKEVFLSHVDMHGPLPTVNPELGECWLWMGGLDKDGYGLAYVNRKTRFSHRVSYALFQGPIPDGLTIDHLCFTKNCVRPNHLEAVTILVNIQRSKRATATHCRRGHEFTPANTALQREGRNRKCIACQRMRERARFIGTGAAH